LSGATITLIERGALKVTKRLAQCLAPVLGLDWRVLIVLAGRLPRELTWAEAEAVVGLLDEGPDGPGKRSRCKEAR